MENEKDLSKDLDFNKKFKGKKLLAWDETTGEYAFVSPRILTSTVYTEDGIPLDDYLVVSPKEVLDKLDKILKEAPKEYDTFKEIAKELDNNKSFVTEILRGLSEKIKRPSGGSAGQVLKLDENGEIVFAEDKDTIYTPPSSYPARMIETDENRRFVTDDEKKLWNNKAEKSEIKKNLRELQDDENHRTITDKDKEKWDNTLTAKNLVEMPISAFDIPNFEYGNSSNYTTFGQFMNFVEDIALDVYNTFVNNEVYFAYKDFVEKTYFKKSDLEFISNEEIENLFE